MGAILLCELNFERQIMDFTTQCFQMIQNKDYKSIAKAMQQYSKAISNFYFNEGSEEIKQYNAKFLNTFGTQLDIAMEQIYEDLQSVELHSVNRIVKDLKRMVTMFQENVLMESRKKGRNKKENKNGSQRGLQLCLECQEDKQKKAIQKMRKELIVTDLGLENCKDMVMTAAEGRKFLASFVDDYELNQRNHLLCLEEALKEHGSFLEKNKKNMGLTFDFLIKMAEEGYFQDNVDISKDLMRTTENTRNVAEIEEITSDKFKDIIEKKIKQSAWQLVCKFLKKVDTTKKEKCVDAQVQTLSFKDSETIAGLQQFVSSLRTEVCILRKSKAETEESLIRSIEEQKEFRQKINQLESQRETFTTKARLFEEQLKMRQSQMREKERKKKDQINKLEEERIAERAKIKEQERALRKQMNSLRKSMVSTKQLKKTEHLISNHNIQNSRSINENQAKKKSSRPSVDGSFISNNYSQQKAKQTANTVEQGILVRKKTTIRRQSNYFHEKMLEAHNHKEDSVKSYKSIQRKEQTQGNSKNRSNKFSFQEFNIQIKEEGSCFFTQKRQRDFATARGAQQNQRPTTINNNKKMRIVRKVRTNVVLKDKSQNISSTQQDNSLTLTERKHVTMVASNEPEGVRNLQRMKTDMSECESRQNVKSLKRLQRMKTTQVLIRNLKKPVRFHQQTQEQEPIVLDLPQIKSSHLQLFGGQKSAQEYESNTGIWPHLVTEAKLVIDIQYSHLSTNIQKFFRFLEEAYPSKHLQYMQFLMSPIAFISANKNKPGYWQRERQRGHPWEIDRNFVKNLFSKLIRFHKIYHKNCSHIMDFLEEISYKQL